MVPSRSATSATCLFRKAALVCLLACIFTAQMATAAAPSDHRRRLQRSSSDDLRVTSLAPICKQVEDSGSIGNHISVSVCDQPIPASQQFVFDQERGIISPKANSKLCLTIGPDKDPDAGTPSLELQSCNPANASVQTFVYNTSTMHLVENSTGKCLDVDASDHEIELYSCNDPPSPNQQWNITNVTSTGNIVSMLSSPSSKMCMTVCEAVSAGKVGSIKSGNFDAKSAQLDLDTDTTAKIRVKVLALGEDRAIRLWMDPDGQFIDTMANEIVVQDPQPATDVKYSETQESFVLATKDLVITIYRSTALLHVQNEDGTTILKESAALQWNTTSTWQTLALAQDEHVYGGGMQCGRFAHRNRSLLIFEGGGWSEGGRPNPAPFYLSTAGYGVLRNTYSHGQYDFFDTATIRHDEYGFDAFYVFGKDPKSVLNVYTQLAGRPPLIPIWGIHFGDSNCYNSKNRTTTDVIAVADGYQQHDLPAGWFIPNDGYGCGYTQLPYVIEQLHDRGYYTALWTSTGLDNATWEIGSAGSRGIKTDVGWVGAGYKFELDAVKLATNLIEGNSNSRRFIWTVCGWAGTHHYSIMWNGDNSGSWDYIRWQIPTVIGSAMSAQAYTSGDVDGIFGGSAETYVRDLQWKTFLPVSMSMSGWATYDKQPWRHGEPYTSINRKYLKLKMRLTPYHYTYVRKANETGVAPARPLMLEFPDDIKTYGNDTQHQFMCGESLLVAPVYANTTTWPIYLPKATWFDYWTGQKTMGPVSFNTTIDLETLPVYVKAGAILPMWPEMNTVFEKAHDPITLDIFPDPSTNSSSRFSLYEDDGTTRNFTSGQFAWQDFDLSSSTDTILVKVSASNGSFSTQPTQRGYVAVLNSVIDAQSVGLNSSALKRYNTTQELDQATQGWAVDPTNRQGAIQVKIAPVPLSRGFQVAVSAPQYARL